MDDFKPFFSSTSVHVDAGGVAARWNKYQFILFYVLQIENIKEIFWPGGIYNQKILRCYPLSYPRTHLDQDLKNLEDFLIFKNILLIISEKILNVENFGTPNWKIV